MRGQRGTRRLLRPAPAVLAMALLLTTTLPVGSAGATPSKPHGPGVTAHRHPGHPAARPHVINPHRPKLPAVKLPAVKLPAVKRPASKPHPLTPNARSTDKVHPAAKGTPRSLPISVRLGGLGLSLNLPLNLPGLLGQPSSSTPTPTPTPTTPAPSTSSAPSGTGSSTGAGNSATGQPSSAARSGSTPRGSAPGPTKSHPAPRPSPTPHPRHSQPNGAFVFVQHLVPNSGASVLIWLCIACALGVAAVVQLSGRRRRKL